MDATALHDKSTIEAHLRRAPHLHLYELADLDELHWPYTQWYGLPVADALAAACLLYTRFRPPVLLALSEEDRLPRLHALMRSVSHLLPPSFYAHLSPGVESALKSSHSMVHHGLFFKMALRQPPQAVAGATETVQQLSEADADDLSALYDSSYPDNWFDPQMLWTGCYFGVRDDGRIVSAAGVHAFSAKYRVAALGNIATLPSHRNRGLATMATARLCQHLVGRVDTIGLNVKSDNHSAIASYQQLGFNVAHTYHEWSVASLSSEA